MMPLDMDNAAYLIMREEVRLMADEKLGIGRNNTKQLLISV